MENCSWFFFYIKYTVKQRSVFLFYEKEMKKYYWVFLVATVVVFLAGCGKKTVNVPLEDQKVPEIFDESQVTSWTCIAACNIRWGKEQSIQLKDCLSHCATIPEPLKNSGEICEDVKKMTKDDCYSSIANETVNADLCGKIEDMPFRYSCYFGIAEKTKDKTICEKIDNETRKYSCQKVTR